MMDNVYNITLNVTHVRYMGYIRRIYIYVHDIYIHVYCVCFIYIAGVNLYYMLQIYRTYIDVGYIYIYSTCFICYMYIVYINMCKYIFRCTIYVIYSTRKCIRCYIIYTHV